MVGAQVVITYCLNSSSRAARYSCTTRDTAGPVGGGASTWPMDN